MATHHQPRKKKEEDGISDAEVIRILSIKLLEIIHFSIGTTFYHNYESLDLFQ